MSFECVHSIQSVVVEDSNLHIVRAGNDPVLPRDEFGSPDWLVADFESLNELLILMVPDIDVSVV